MATEWSYVKPIDFYIATMECLYEVLISDLIMFNIVQHIHT